MTLLARLLANTVCAPSGCLIWCGADSGAVGRGSGYAKAVVGGETRYVHVVVWELTKGRRVPPGHQVDHLCARWTRGLSRRCIRPEHLEAVPAVVNQRRKVR